MNICLREMTKDLARCYFQKFVVDQDLYMDNQEFRPYVYSQEKVDATVERYGQMGRVYLAVMLDREPIGEVVLKNIDHNRKECTMGISLRSDEFKNRGYGAAAEILTLQYAFEVIGMNTVFADSILKNTCSQHVPKKVGFTETHRDGEFVYFRCDREKWIVPDTCKPAILGLS